MVIIAERFVIQPHHFIAGALLVKDIAPTHRRAATVDWVEAPLSIVCKCMRWVAEEKGSMTEGIWTAEARAARYRIKRSRRAILRSRQHQQDLYYASLYAQEPR